MTDKCTKFEALFTFRPEEELLEHIKTCDDCREEYEKMQKVTSLIQEVRPQLRERRKNLAKVKVACAMFMVLFAGTTLGLINFNTEISDTLKYGSELTSEDLGFPVDSYGLISLE